MTHENHAVFTEAPPLPDADERLVSVYARAGRTLDDLPYTPDFEDIYQRLGEHGDDRSRQEIFRRLHNLRKAGRLPRLGRASSAPISLDEGSERDLASLVEHAVGQLGKRDQLVYTPQFDRVVEEFNKTTHLALSPHDLWRLVARLAK